MKTTTTPTPLIRTGTLQSRLDSCKGVSHEEMSKQFAENCRRTGVKHGAEVEIPNFLKKSK